MAVDQIATVYFLDVGQGTSQVISFADGSLVVIDCGASADALVMLLKTISFTKIQAVVLSHWHDDHVNGTFPQSMDVQSQKDTNQGSGILLLEYGKGRILFPGDAGKKAFKSLVSRLSNSPISCSIMAAPHHSGKLNTGSTAVKGFRNCYHW